MDAVLIGSLQSRGAPVAGATVLVSDEGEPVASGVTDASGAFAVPVAPGRYTVRAFHPDAGGGVAIASAGVPFALELTPAGCWGYVDLPDPAALTDAAFRDTWGVEALARPPAGTVYRWFWERPGAPPAILTLAFDAEGLVAGVRARDGDGWAERSARVPARRARRVEGAIVRSGYWELEHLDTRGACRPGAAGASAWTIEAWASPGYRAVFRLDPVGTPLAALGWAWTRAAGWKVRRRDFR